MKIKIAINAFSLAVALALSGVCGLWLTGCAGDRYNRSTGEYIDDHTITSHVSDALHNNSEYKFDTVQVACFKGNVQLSGFVDSEAQKYNAAKITKTVQGVRDVENDITVGGKNTSRSTGEYIDDKSLTQRVNHALNGSQDYKFGQVNVTSLQGTVQLSGFVDKAEDKTEAGDIVKNVPGVKAVENNITVKDTLNQ